MSKMFRIKISKDPIQTIQDLIQFNESIDHIGKVADIGKGWKGLKKNMMDYLINLENSFSTLIFTEISEDEFHTMLEHLLKNTKKALKEAKHKNKLHHNDFDFILSILHGLSKVNKNKMKNMDNLVSERFVDFETQD
jgi:Glu-tRNA(Gln) amidotransferase subunit E-like FAD-binding protein